MACADHQSHHVGCRGCEATGFTPMPAPAPSSPAAPAPPGTWDGPDEGTWDDDGELYDADPPTPVPPPDAAKPVGWAAEVGCCKPLGDGYCNRVALHDGPCVNTPRDPAAAPADSHQWWQADGSRPEVKDPPVTYPHPAAPTPAPAAGQG